jgi:hypothetical protein
MPDKDSMPWKQKEFKANYAEALNQCEELYRIIFSIMREGNGDADVVVVRARFEEANKLYPKTMALVEILKSEMAKRLAGKKRGELTFQQSVDKMNITMLTAVASRFMSHLQDVFGPFIREEQFLPKKGEEDAYDW